MDRLHVMLNYIATLFPALLVVITVNGFSRAFIAKLMGDATAEEEGFLTLNPLAHVNIIGLISTLFLIGFLMLIFGEALTYSVVMTAIIIGGASCYYKPTFNENRFRNRRLGAITTLLSGFIGLSLLILVVLYTLKYFPFNSLPKAVTKPLINIFIEIVNYSSWFIILDLIPIPPFDGADFLPYIIPYKYHYIVDWLEENGLFIYFFLLLMPVVSDVFFGMLSYLSGLLKMALYFLVF